MTPAKASLEAQSAKSADVRAGYEIPDEILEAATALGEADRASRGHATLAEALVAAQAEMPAVEKDSVNPHFKSKFVSLDHLIAKTRPVLNRHGLSISQWPTFVRVYGGGDQTPLPALLTVISHVSGERIESTMPLILGKNDMQGLGSALTYAKRYAWAAALGISTDEDDDGNAASRPEVNPQQATGARRSASRPEPTPRSVRASDTELEEYRAEVLEAGFEWLEKYEAMSAVEIADLRSRLAAHVAQKAAEASA